MGRTGLPTLVGFYSMEILTEEVGGWTDDQFLKCLFCKNEDLGSIPQSPCKKSQVWWYTCHLGAKEGEMSRCLGFSGQPA